MLCKTRLFILTTLFAVLNLVNAQYYGYSGFPSYGIYNTEYSLKSFVSVGTTLMRCCSFAGAEYRSFKWSQ